MTKPSRDSERSRLRMSSLCTGFGTPILEPNAGVGFRTADGGVVSAHVAEGLSGRVTALLT